MSDVGVIERGQHLGFPLKARHAFGIAEKRRRQDLERHVTLEHRIARAVDLAHATCAKQGEYFVVTEFVAYGQRHITDFIQFTRSRTSLRLDDVRSLSEASRRTTVEEQDEGRAGALRIES